MLFLPRFVNLTMKVEQYVMAYQVEQDRLRAMLPDGFESLRPVLRINAEIRDEDAVYLELNMPVAAQGKHGWLNIAHWNSDIHVVRQCKCVSFQSQFLTISFTGVGIEGGCPAEKDNDGCFFLDTPTLLRLPETIYEKKEFCDCEFAWHFADGDAFGKSLGKTLPAYPTELRTIYPHQELNAKNAAAIECIQVLGCYCVKFER